VTRKLIIVGLALTSAVLATPAAATAPLCTFLADTGEGSVTVEMDDDTFVRMFVDEGGEIKAFFEGEGATDCGEATTANTGFIDILGRSGNDVIFISQRGEGGPFPSDIRFNVSGDGGTNALGLIGTRGPDHFRLGIDPTDLGVDPAADLYGSGPPRIQMSDISLVAVGMLAGNDRVTGRPDDSFDGPFPLPLDIFGGTGADQLIGSPDRNEINAGPGDDLLKGLAGRDVLFAKAGDDLVNGGPGVDVCDGGRGDDRLRGCEA